ncbi:MAG: glutamine hydrolyzing CTP synthase [Candidatus Micrarchaeia archaeon]
MQTKYVVVLGLLLSGLGKGIVTSSIAKILQFYNYRVRPLKFDGYLNYDCGTMNPYRHGEVFVLDDKGEVDMDFGNYERFLNIDMNSDFSITGGKLFSEIIAKERKGDFLGRDVQFIPHMTEHIISKIESISEKYKLDTMVIEVGGTVGDIENNYFIEAMRQLALRRKVVFVAVTYVPELATVGEQKTKPTQLALRMLMQMGISPDFIVCRSEKPLEENVRDKLAVFSSLSKEHIISDNDIESIYELPMKLMEQGLDKMLIASLNEDHNTLNQEKFSSWKTYLERARKAKEGASISIGVVGKYVGLRDSYASVKEALNHAAATLNAALNIKWIESEELEGISEQQLAERLGNLDGILVPGGFGNRGIEGMIRAIKYARENKIPYLGLCLGMQLMTIEYARNMCNLKGANSTEFDKNTKYKVIDLMESQRWIKQKGGTMRLGAWDAVLKDGSIAKKAYKKRVISERHRHRYEFNNKYKNLLEKKGLNITGTTPDGKLVECVEWKDSFGVATQFHCELKSRPEAPAPLFLSFISSALKFQQVMNKV